MKQETRNKLNFIGRIFIIILYIVSGIGTFFIIGKSKHENMIYLGIILLLIGFTETILYQVTSKKTEIYCHDIVISILEMAVGAVFIIYNDSLAFTLDSACIMWGVIEIVKCVMELWQIVQEFKEIKWYVFVDLVLTLVCLTFGILLCFHLKEGIRLHLIVTGSVLITWAITDVFRFFVVKTKTEK